MKRPSFQFYTGDWTANPNLRRCTFAEKGIWIDVLCLMHDQPEYGVLRWPLEEIAEAVKCRAVDLRALVRKEVLKGNDKHLAEPFIYVPRSGRKDGDPVTLINTQPGPVWYSSRMVKDEHVRSSAGASTRFGGTPPSGQDAPSRSPPPSPSRREGERQGGDQGDGSSSSSSSSLKEPPTPKGAGRATNLHEFPPGFERFWSAYPRKDAKDAAAKAFAKRRPDAATVDAMVAAIVVQADSEQWRKDRGQFIPLPATWLNQGRWMDEGVAQRAGCDPWSGVI